MTELFKKYRPKRFRDVVGNSATVGALAGALETGDVPHTCLFHGPPGTGKTTLARILAKELQCSDMDFAELNSAAYRGIDSIRDIQRSMNLSPANGPVRVWLLDEVHKLSNDAQNAALKMWEDTPKHVYFFLCTTDPGKLLAAVRSRCTEYPVKSLSPHELELVYVRVANKEKLSLPPASLDACIVAADGSARTLLVMVDKLRHLPPDQHAVAIEEQKAVENQSYDLCKALIAKKPWRVVADILRNLKGEPEDVRRHVNGYARSVLLGNNTANHHQAYLVLDCFKGNFYDSGQAGLALAAFEATLAK